MGPSTPTPAPTRVPTPPTGQQYLGQNFAKATNKKLKNHDFLIYAVMAVTAVAFVGITVAVVTLFTDQARFNSQAYNDGKKEMTSKIEALQADVAELNVESRKQAPTPTQPAQ